MDKKNKNNKTKISFNSNVNKNEKKEDIIIPISGDYDEDDRNEKLEFLNLKREQTEEEYSDEEYADEEEYNDDEYIDEEEYNDEEYIDEEEYNDEEYVDEEEYNDDEYVDEEEYKDEEYADEEEYNDDEYIDEEEYSDEEYADEEEYNDEEYVDEEEYNDEEYVDEEEVVREITTKEIKEEDFLACVGNKEEKVNSKKVVKKKLRLKKGVKLFIYGLILLVSAGLLVFSGLKLFAWWQDNQKISKIEDEIGEMAVVEEVVDDENVEFFGEDGETSLSDYFYYIGLPLINVNFDDLLVKNSDTVGWIKVSGTNINYPVVQSADNDYYLHKAFDGTPNEAGWIFLDYRNNMENLAKNNIIYGHSRVDTTMFGTLPNIVKQSWFNNKDNHVVWLSTPTHNTLWQVFSVYIIDETSDYLQINFNDASYTAFIDMIKGRSKYDFGTSVTVNDKILSLSSCYGNTQRVVLHAKLIKKSTR